MFQAIDESNLGDALYLLGQGFPEKPAKFWTTAIDRLRKSDGNAQAEVPIGQILYNGKTPAGVILMPASVKTDDHGQAYREINFSSWYMTESERWRGPMMLRQLMRYENAKYTDFTPTDSVKKILGALGFEPINEGVSLNLLPLSCMQLRRGVSVVPFSDWSTLEMPVACSVDLGQYEDFGCHVAALIDGEEVTTVAFRPVTSRAIKLATLVYSQNNAAVYRNLGAIGRFLAQHSIHVLVLDIPPGGQIPGIERKLRGNKYARGIKASNRTDYLGSELSLFDW